MVLGDVEVELNTDLVASGNTVFGTGAAAAANSLSVRGHIRVEDGNGRAMVELGQSGDVRLDGSLRVDDVFRAKGDVVLGSRLDDTVVFEVRPSPPHVGWSRV